GGPRAAKVIARTAIPALPLREISEPIRLPVEVGPGDVHAVADAVELVVAVGVGGPELVERGELRQVAEAVLGGLGHRHLAGHEPSVALAWVDPERFRALLGEERRGLIVGDAAEEEARREADGTRRRGDEVGGIA